MVNRVNILIRPVWVVLILVIGILAVPACSPAGNSSPQESIVVAWSPFESTALLWIATEQHFFRQNGLEITLRQYPTGAGALAGMVKGEADIAVGISEFPAVGMVFRKEAIRIIGNIDKGEFIYLIGRKDRGIEKVSDLKGKTVGTTIGTVAHFHLGRLLVRNGLNFEDITLVDLKTAEEWVNAVANGDIDAVVTAQPYANYARARLGDNARVVSAQGGQYLNGLLIISEEGLKKHPERVNRFLKSLVQAETYLEANPTESKEIIQKSLNLDAAYMEIVWSQNQFSLSLDQSLILIMEDEARWLINNNLTIEKSVPNFLNYIDADSLKSVKPGAVSITVK